MQPQDALNYLANAAAKVLPISEANAFNAAIKVLAELIPKPAADAPKAE
jgi:hypothetical protein